MFQEINPFGFILFTRNCANPTQVIQLIDELRRSVNRPDAPVFIDQEGGSVRRLRPPLWHTSPELQIFGSIYGVNKSIAYKAVNLSGRLIAGQLSQVGININCAPVLDVLFSKTTSAIRGRSFGSDPSLIIELANSFCEGLLSGGVLPVIKHMPGHGRATEDSHQQMPIVRATRREVGKADFMPFRSLASMPFGMTAHVLYEKLDKNKTYFTKEEVEFLAMHKKNVTFETTPQHLTMYAPDCYDKLGTYAQMNPPLRTKEHYDRLWVAIKNNIVDVLGSDHAPHLKKNKDKEYPNSPSGMPGVQTIFPVMLDHVNNGKLTLQQLINLMCENPCKIFGIKNKGYLKEGYDADLTIADMNKEVVIKNEMIASKCGWTPFNNHKVKGFPVATIVNGHLVMSNGKVIMESKGTPLKF